MHQAAMQYQLTLCTFMSFKVKCPGCQAAADAAASLAHGQKGLAGPCFNGPALPDANPLQ